MTLELLKLIAAQVIPEAEVSHLRHLPSMPYLVNPINAWMFQADWPHANWREVGTLYCRDLDIGPVEDVIRAELERMQMSFTRLSALRPNPFPNTSGSGPTPRP